MHRVILPAICTLIYLGALVGPDGVVTGVVAAKLILVGTSSYLGCCLTDWISDRVRGDGQET